MPEAIDQVRRDGRMPLYHQLSDILRARILQGDWRPGEITPGEAELIEHYKVSRATVRQALDILTREGLIYRHRGRGTFVAHPTIRQWVGRIITFTEDMRERGFAPGTRILSAEVVHAPGPIAKELGVSTGDEMVRLQRLRLADDEPMSVEESWLVHRLCPGLLKLRQELEKRSLRELLASEYGLRWARATQSIHAINATRQLAELLATRVGAALLYIERVSYTEQGVPAEFLRLHHRGDRYALYSELRR